MEISELYELYRQHPVITTDSRDCPSDSIFVALRGDSFNGNQFAAAALERGCAYAIVDDATVVPTDEQAAAKYILVDDCLRTFKLLAREHRRQFDIPVIAITGTNGKTTTKELVAAVLGEKYKVLFTQGNFNNDVGVPKTLFRLDEHYDIAVIEMGASHPGDIRTLVETAEPTCGLITNVGRAHLEGFGSFENVVKTKGELYDYLGSRPESLVFVNADNDNLTEMLPDSVWVSPYSTDPDNAYDCIQGEVVSCSPFLTFRWREPLGLLQERGEKQKWNKVRSQLIGAYNVDNMLAAVAVGINFGVPREQICHALASYKPSNNRSQLTVTARNHLVVDAYNANPTSMAAAIDNFCLMEVPRKMAILGDMRELGKASEQEHRHIVDMLQMADFDEVWLVGSEFAAIPSSFRKFKDVEEVKAAIEAEKPSDFYILIKGSNSTRLYQLPELL